MARNISLTLDSLKFANVYGFERSFGTKKTSDVNGGSLTTKEFNEANALPFDLQRPIDINDSTNITSIQYDAKVNIISSTEVALVIGNGAYVGVKVELFNSSITIHKLTINGKATPYEFKKGEIISLIWIGNEWRVNDGVATGMVKSFMGTSIPLGYIACNSTIYNASDYPYLWNELPEKFKNTSNNTFCIDLSECSLVGTGTSGRPSTELKTHDPYTLGQFKDDQMQSHTHDSVLRYGFQVAGPGYAVSSAGTEWGNNTSSGASGRTGSTTHGKLVGTNFIIKY